VAAPMPFAPPVTMAVLPPTLCQFRRTPSREIMRRRVGGRKADG
jgi:hypothetical protein